MVRSAAVYNQPEFLLAGIYLTSDDAGSDNNAKTGSGWSVNGEYRPIPKWSVLGRYDHFENDSNITCEEYIAGIAYSYSKNVKFIGNVFHIDTNTDMDDDAAKID